MDRRTVIKALAACGAVSLLKGTGSASSALAADPSKDGGKWWMPVSMDAMTALHTRRSVRSFTKDLVDLESIRSILAAGMSAPSSQNGQQWQFIVVQKREILDKYPTPIAAKAPLAILVCGEDGGDQRWIPGVCACTQNMLLAAHSIGLGAVWTAAFPYEKSMDAYRKLFSLPQNIVPLSSMIIGHPASTPAPENRFVKAKIHYDGWQ